MDRRHDQAAAAAGTSLVGEFVCDVVLWRRGRGDVSACLLAATAASWMLFFSGSGGTTLLSLSANVLLLLLTVLFLWAKAARLLNRYPPPPSILCNACSSSSSSSSPTSCCRPQPPIPELRVSQQVVDEVAALLHAGLDAGLAAFRDIALGRDSLLFCRAFLCLWITSILGSLTDFPTFCYTSVVAVLTIPALYQKYQDCVDRYMRFAYINLHMYEMVYERFSMKCFLRVRECLVEFLKDP
ncbi:hypothetical protein ACP4OV_028688 [Aristida adscensionis]